MNMHVQCLVKIDIYYYKCKYYMFDPKNHPLFIDLNVSIANLAQKSSAYFQTHMRASNISYQLLFKTKIVEYPIPKS